MQGFTEGFIAGTVVIILGTAILWTVAQVLYAMLNSANKPKKIKVKMENSDKNSKLGVKTSKTKPKGR